MIVGITGKFGVGKSTISEMLRKKGAFIIDADKVVERIYEPDCQGTKKIQNFFGRQFLLKNGRVNKNKLKKLVFNNEKKLQILNNIIHPIVFHEIRKEIDRKKAPFIIIEAMDFSEKYLRKLIDKLIVVTSPIRLIQQRKKISEEEIKKIHSFQKTPEKYDFFIENKGTKKKLEKKVNEFIKSCFIKIS
ncbi:dephospho-CoA kinase [Candidatus Peregrinibacteria bacterium]|nr:dephospho-CoA kinase [Candidatus Peregrinibacteria bacterium]